MATEMNMELIDEHRYINVDADYWYEYIFDQYTQRLRRIGFEAEDFQFSGFCSQGDGASFTGTVRNWARLLRAMGGYSPLRAHYTLLKYLQEEHPAAQLTRSNSRYSHENTVTFSLEATCFGDIQRFDSGEQEYKAAINLIKELLGLGIDDLQAVAYAIDLKKYDLDAIEHDVQDYLRGVMQELYCDLEREFDYLTSDEVVWDTIVANELHTEAV